MNSLKFKQNGRDSKLVDLSYSLLTFKPLHDKNYTPDCVNFTFTNLTFNEFPFYLFEDYIANKLNE